MKRNWRKMVSGTGGWVRCKGMAERAGILTLYFIGFFLDHDITFYF